MKLIDYNYRNYPFCEFSGQQLEALRDSLGQKQVSVTSSFIQTSFSTLYAKTSDSFRWNFSSVAKRILPNDKAHLTDQKILDVTEFINLTAFDRLKDQPAYVFTHDIDYNRCMKNTIKVAKIEHDSGIRATFFFLVNAGYSLDRQVLLELKAMGHNIGLHGVTYDLRLAMRPKDKKFDRIAYGKDKLEDLSEGSIRSFRNHSLMYSPDFIDCMDSLGLDLSSNLFPRGKLSSMNVNFCWPFKYSGKNVFEVPTTWPLDTHLFRSAQVNKKTAIAFWKKRISSIHRLGGITCLNHHPGILSGRFDYFTELLEMLVDQGFKNKSLAEVI